MKVNNTDNKVFLIRNVSSDKFGGGEVYQLSLAGELKKNGFCPVIVTNSEKLLRMAEEEGFKTLKPPYIKNQNWSGWRNLLLLEYCLFQKKLVKWYVHMFQQYKPKIINVQSRDDMIAATKAARKFRIRVLWTDHADFKNWVLWNVNKKLKNFIGKKIIKLSKNVDAVIFVSKNLMDETKKMIEPKKINNSIVIKNGVVDKMNKYANIRPKKGSFVFIGRIVSEKGISELIEAFYMVRREYSYAILNIYGDGPDLNKYRDMAKSGGVYFGGTTDNPLKIMAENEIFVLPSYKEGLSLSLIDAAMMKKVIIASDVDGNPEVVNNEKTGILVPVKDVDKLAEAMMHVLKNYGDAKKMAIGARKKYKKEFNLDKIFIEEMLPLYIIEKDK